MEKRGVAMETRGVVMGRRGVVMREEGVAKGEGGVVGGKGGVAQGAGTRRPVFRASRRALSANQSAPPRGGWGGWGGTEWAGPCGRRGNGDGACALTLSPLRSSRGWAGRGGAPRSLVVRAGGRGDVKRPPTNRGSR